MLINLYYTKGIERFDGQIENEKQRRRKLASLLPSDSMTIISAARTLYMTNDIPYVKSFDLIM